MWSTSQNRWVQGPECGPAYWLGNLREPVRFVQAVQALAADGPAVFVELCPHPVLVRPMQETLAALDGDGTVIASCVRGEGERESLLTGAERLWLSGGDVDWAGVHGVFDSVRPQHVLTLSAKSEAGLAAQAAQLSDHLSSEDTPDLAAVAHALATTRSAFSHRVAVVATDAASAARSLRNLEGAALGRASGAPPSVAFLFTGQGAQHAGMGRELYETQPVFREALDRCAALLDGALPKPLLSVLYPAPGEPSAIDDTAFTQPALFALEYALHALWRSWGVTPAYVLGHSVGEYVAACVAGVFSLEDGLKLIAARGALMQALPSGGAMVSIEAPEAEVAEAVAPHAAEVSVAAINGPAQTVISGAEGPVTAIAESFSSRGVRTKALTVSHAFHSPLMRPMLEAFRAVAESVTYSAPSLPLVSNVDGAIASEAVATAEYWVAHVEAAVRFSDGVDTVLAAGVTQLVELGPKPVLCGAGLTCAPDADVSWLPSLRAGKSDHQVILGAVGRLWCAGVEIDWSSFDAPWPRPRVALPTYAFDRQRYWLESMAPTGAGGEDTGHSLLGYIIPVAGEGAGATFEMILGEATHPYLWDHRVFGNVVVPATALMELGRAAADAYYGPGRHAIADLQLKRVLVLPAEGGHRRMQVVVAATDGVDSFTVYSQAMDAKPSDGWTAHASGRLVSAVATAVPAPVDPTAFGARCPIEVEVASQYATHDRSGLSYGPTFQGVTALHHDGAGRAVSRVVLPSSEEVVANELHPALLDAALQTLFAAAPGSGDGAVYLPFEIERFVAYRTGVGEAWVEASVSGSQSSEVLTASVAIFDAAGAAVASIEGAMLKRTDAAALAAATSSSALRSDWVYLLDWLALPPAPDAATVDTSVPWLVWSDAAATSDVARSVAARLSAAGASVELCTSDDLGAKLAALAPSDAIGVVALWSAGDPAAPAIAATERATSGLVQLQALLAAGHARGRLIWATTDAIATSSETPALGCSSLWGLGRVWQTEHQQWSTTLLDVAAASGTDAMASAVWSELTATDGESQVAARNGRRLGARLVRAPRRPPEPSTTHFREQSSVVITGGLGALGLEVARWLVEAQGVEHVVLLGRRAPSQEAQAIIDSMVEAGATVQVASCDVTNRDDLQAVLQSLPADRPLRGVIHAAGVLDDGVVSGQSAERFERVLAPKVQGAWNLHTLTKDLDLDAFVLFSSVASWMGTGGQSNYAAANAFLDALAAARSASGLPATSIAWGPWSDGGMAARMGAADKARMARTGFELIETRQGLALLDACLSRDEPMLGALPLDLRRFRSSLGSGPAPSLYRLIAGDRGASSVAPQASLVDELRGLSEEARRARVQALISEEAQRVMGVASVPVAQPLRGQGLDSLMAVELTNALVAKVGVSLPETLLFDYPTVEVLSEHVVTDVLELEAGGPTPVEQFAPSSSSEPIAIVGMACRYPGGVADPDALWSLMCGETDAVTDIPLSRWDVDALYDPDPEAIGKMSTRCMGSVDDVDAFDAGFFGISGREARWLDPQQRLLLEVSWEALERAGLTAKRLEGSATGVFVGVMSHDYADLQAGDLERLDGYLTTGNLGSVASGRISYAFGLVGPSATIDTACSSSLVTMHLACQSLRSGECDLALSGGATLVLTPALHVEFSRLRGLAADGRCKTFSADADGVGWSEGCGMIVLKRLSDAVRDGDDVLAVVRGTAVNQDGRSQGLTAPNGPSQQAVVRRALAQAGLQPNEIDYVECHGTGTTLGDPIEVQALGAVLGKGRAPDDPVLLGSLKSNIGHTQAAAGVGGVIKTVLAMRHDFLPASIHAESLNPKIAWADLPVEVVAQGRAWAGNGAPRRAGVSSFGISGTNAHVIVQEAPPQPEATAAEQSAPARPQHVLTVSAKSDAALRAQATRLAEHLASNDLDLGDVAASLASRRTAFARRRAVVAADAPSAIEALGRLDTGPVSEIASPPTVAFLFTGQGAQHVGMGRELYETQPVFREALDRCAAILDGALPQPLLSVLYPAPGEPSPIDDTAFTQPALFALEYALHALWRSWGVTPAYVLGHSVGEYVAACVAGVFSLEDGLKLIAARGALMQALPSGGAMVSIEAPEAEVAEAVAPHVAEVSVAAINGPAQTVMSGAEGPVTAIAEAFASRGIRTKALTVSHAFHSPLMRPMLEAFRAVAESVTYSAPSLPLVSNVDGAIASEAVATAEYWVGHVEAAVRFADGVDTVLAAGATQLVELGPKPVLCAAGLACAPDADVSWLPSLRAGKSDHQVLLDAVGRLWCAGVDIDWSSFDAPWPRQRVALPSYAFDRQRYWLQATAAARASGEDTGHSLLGRLIPVAGEGGAIFETLLGATTHPYLLDHQVFGALVVPGTALLELGRAAAEAYYGPGRHAVEGLVLTTALMLPEDGAGRRVQVVVTSSESVDSFTVYSQARDASPSDGWTSHASGRLVGSAPAPEPAPVDPKTLASRCPTAVDVSSTYASLASSGLTYGPMFQGLDRLHRDDAGRAVSRVVLPSTQGLPPDELHPALLDAALQTLSALTPPAGDGDVYLPFEIDRFTAFRTGVGEVWVSASLTSSSAEVLTGSVAVFDVAGAAVAALEGVQLRRADAAALAAATSSPGALRSDWLYHLDWLALPIPAAGSTVDPSLTHVIWTDAESASSEVVRALQSKLVSSGATVATCVGEDLQATLTALAPETSIAVVAVWPADPAPAPAAPAPAAPAPAAPAPAAPAPAAIERATTGLRHLQALLQSGVSAGRLLWVTTDAVATSAEGGRDLSATSAASAASATSATLWGLGRVWRSEHPEWSTTLLDLSASATADDAAEAVSFELTASDGESQVAVREGQRLGARLVRASKATDGALTVPSTEAYGLDKPASGRLEDLQLAPRARRAPGAGEVEIEIEAAGLNFRDVMNALGMYPGDAGLLGGECAGVVTAVGADVAHLAAGDLVIGLAPGSFGPFVTVDARLVARRPEGLSATEAAGIPIAFLTAWYAFHDLSALQRGERVLVHAASGGVGMAATQIARWLGAEVYGTASLPKQDAVRALGVEHVSSSRTLDFVQDFQAATDGRGVHVVLNALAGDFVDASLSLLADGGRFVEMGKTDIRSAEWVASSHSGVTYRAFDLMDAGADRIQAMLSALVPLFESGALRPLPTRGWPLPRAREAFGFMSRAKHVGKLVLTTAPTTARFRPGSSVLVTGGLGALGLETARWLVEAQGVEHVVLLGRRAPSQEAQAVIDSLGESGATVQVAACDVTSLASLQAVLHSLPADRPLRGVIHAAGVLDDGVVSEQTPERFERVLAPKVLGAWNLHTLTQELDLDAFVLFSSVAAWLGTGGQSNYAAANAFLDALAAIRFLAGRRARPPATCRPSTKARRAPRRVPVFGRARAGLRRAGDDCDIHAPDLGRADRGGEPVLSLPWWRHRPRALLGAAS